MRLKDLVEKWIKDRIMLEQMTETVPVDVCIFVKERQPDTAAEIEKLADDCLLARKQFNTVQLDQ